MPVLDLAKLIAPLGRATGRTPRKLEQAALPEGGLGRRELSGLTKDLAAKVPAWGLDTPPLRSL